MEISIAELNGANLGAIAATAVSLLLFGLLFNQLINHLHRSGLNDGYVWLEGVVGDLAVIIAAGFTLGWGASLLLLLYFAAAGFCMAAGDIYRHVQARQREAQERASE